MLEQKNKVAIVGAGPVGLSLAALFIKNNIKFEILDKSPYLLKKGSKACLIQGDVLEILNKIGCAQNISENGIHWRKAHTYINQFKLPIKKYPKRLGFAEFVNISQYEIENELLSFIKYNGFEDSVKWNHNVVNLEQLNKKTILEIKTKNKTIKEEYDYVFACDGVRSKIRDLLNLDFQGYTHSNEFLITDIKTKLKLPKERHFWFNAIFHPGKQLVIHPQPDDIWRIDWQLEKGANIEQEKVNGKLNKRIRKVIGNIPFEIKWLSTYKFNQKVLKNFIYNRIFFLGDAAHSFPPYGSRGMNSGIQDADNLAWKIYFVMKGISNKKLLESYNIERRDAALENLRITDATMRFIAPTKLKDKLWSKFILFFSKYIPIMRNFIDNGKMSEPFTYKKSSIINKNNEKPLVGRFLPDDEFLSKTGETKRLRDFLDASNFLCLFFCNFDEADTVRNAIDTISNFEPIKFMVISNQHLENKFHPEIITLRIKKQQKTSIFYENRLTVYIVRPDGHICSHIEQNSLNQLELIIKKNYASKTY